MNELDKLISGVVITQDMNNHWRLYKSLVQFFLFYNKVQDFVCFGDSVLAVAQVFPKLIQTVSRMKTL